MGYYLISCGGTGAKCTEAFTHLVASGLMSDDQPVKVFFMDADLANGQNVSAQEAITDYQKAQIGLKSQGGNLADCPIFKTQIGFDDGHIWDPLPAQNHDLDNILKTGNLSTELQGLYRFLYSEDKRKATFENGFLGWPSVGSAIISSHQDRLAHFLQNIAADTNAKVFLVGSIFGGTGAASIPTLAKILNNLFKEADGGNNRSLGLALLLPYFNFNNQNGDDNENVNSATGKITNPNIDPMNFLLKTQMALSYYYHHQVHDYCDRIYLLGDSVKSLLSNKVAIGGGEQKNHPHYIELYAGLAAIDFFGGAYAQGGSPYVEVARHAPRQLSWKDLPHAQGWKHIYNHLGKFYSTGFAFNCRFAPVLEQYRLNPNADVSQHNWIRTMIQNQFDLHNSNHVIENIHSYFQNLFKWTAKLHTPLPTNPEKVDLQLLNQKVLSHYLNKGSGLTPNPELYEDLSHPYHHEFMFRPPELPQPPRPGFLNPQEGFNWVANKVNRAKPPGETQGLGRLFHALHHFAI